MGVILPPPPVSLEGLTNIIIITSVPTHCKLMFLLCDATQSAVLLRLSVTLRYRDEIGWNSSKIFSPLVSLGSSLSSDPNIMDLLQGGHPEISAGIGEG